MQSQLAIKILIIFVVGILLLIPISMVKHKIKERQAFLDQAKAAVAKSWTGSQTIFTPILVVPYQRQVPIASPGEQSPDTVNSKTVREFSFIVPNQLDQKIKVDNDSVYKGIYEVPVYSSSILLTGMFNSEKLNEHLQEIENKPQFKSIETPYLTLHIADMRGIDRKPELLLNQKAMDLHPGSHLKAIGSGLHTYLDMGLARDKTLNFSLTVSLRGMEQLSFVPLADHATIQLQSNWPHPEFIGASLPKHRDITKEGFFARWEATRFSGHWVGFADRCISGDDCKVLLSSSSGVRFIEPIDIYLQSERVVKYAILFIGLSFISFFIFEQVARRRIHPIQYAFVGLAISLFYLLLISLSEHIVFFRAYLIGVLCCSSLILFYVRYMLGSFKSALLFSAMIVVLYSLLYVIVQAEDFALLMGTALVFLVLAALMYTTRNIDWYNIYSHAEAEKLQNSMLK
ncbi:cell envelope integrity protein CreD [Microbulbifer discodermiae]|uniref:cell envelope integrity protein CreD n=1 Tax=Microbulbifer sp. 2201CG32-9 TaxID=3232309 RepID=UPI00345BB766